ncbi:hypothetical protein HG535_0H03630 [Zygotorulaspora mrakii]|uniref:Alpha-1,6-mannosyltransferase MNN11 n=1 Tax=Zygotorulaspora mrakii TaxID=42260 RepID=A0A7H9B9I0_ZYGMR|nr:uncharacterized protein HG535_0H03630 [Zygotorulaspora mrakii]QLG75036.1 hypothetical protein HG535_0H03630 [Zygotorulaspora mrakii]
MALRPKSKLKSGSKKKWSISPRVNNIFTKEFGLTVGKSVKPLGILAGITIFLYLCSSIFSYRNASRKQYLPEHGYYMNEMPAKSSLIFPPIEHMPVLRELGIGGLYNTRTDLEGNKGYVLKPEDKPLTDEEKKKTTDQVLLVKKSFLDHGKWVYKKETPSPEIVIVTLIDFELSELETVFNVVQNRVDYAQKQKYAVYIRWIQEFVPMLQRQNLRTDYEYAKPLIMRAAMHAFPKAKYLFFLDHESLIMNLDISLQQNLLDPKTLEIALLKNTPVVAESNIRTYNHFQVKNTKMIIPQSPQGFLDMSAFVVSNDLYGKAFLEFLMDKLYTTYDWESFSAGVGHLLQWHPHILGKTALVHQKLLAAPVNPNPPSEEEGNNSDKELDPYYYTEGDLVVSLKGCRLKGTCTQDLRTFYEKVRIH